MGEDRPVKGTKRAPLPTTPDALDVAMERAGDSDVARTLLEKHSKLIDAQIKSERLEHGAKRMVIFFRGAIGLVALAILLALVWMAARARADRGLVIEALSVPPDLAQRGLTGEAVAAELADRLSAIDQVAQSFRSPETMKVNWGDDIKIVIPSTGVSIGELDTFLRRQLGGQTIIGGSVYRTPTGLRLTVRAGANGAINQTGSDTTLDAMVQKAAEGVFEKTQPYRYSKYLEFTGRKVEAMAVARTLAANSGDPKERAWAWAQVSNLLEATDARAAARAGYRAIQEDPTNALAYLNTCIPLSQLSHDWAAGPICEKAAVLGSQPEGGLSPIGVNTSQGNLATRPAQSGDFATALGELRTITGQQYAGVAELKRGAMSSLLTGMHDVRGSLKLVGSPSDAYFAEHFSGSGSLTMPQVDQAVALDDWPRAIVLLKEILAVVDREPEGPDSARLARERWVLPRLAMILARDGRIDQARAIAASLPEDCLNCLVAKGVVAGLGGDFATAERLIAQADQARPNSPFAEAALAKIFFRAGQYHKALDFAERASRKGPRYADALKVRGDALRKLGRVDEAQDFYAQAEKLAPRWGRLQIDWGIAAARLGRIDEARGHFAKAATMDLGARDRQLLNQLRAMAGTA
ncbi:MAG: hypothetical protein ABIR51_07080 [Sphingomicrobium sp.]